MFNIVNIIVTNQLSGECQVISIFLNHLSLVEQGTCKYVGCSWLSAPETNLVQHYLLVSLDNLEFFLILYTNCAISVAAWGVKLLFLWFLSLSYLLTGFSLLKSIGNLFFVVSTRNFFCSVFVLWVLHLRQWQV